MIKVRIIKHYYKNSWYAHQIGSIVKVYDWNDRYYKLSCNDQIEPDRCCILKEDCEVITQEKQDQDFKLIPFDWGKYKSGLKPIYRNGTRPIRIDLFEELNHSQKLFTISECHNGHWHLESGKFLFGDEEFELFLEQPLEKHTVWINVIRMADGHSRPFSIPYNSKKEALEARESMPHLNFIDFIKYDYYR